MERPYRMIAMALVFLGGATVFGFGCLAAAMQPSLDVAAFGLLPGGAVATLAILLLAWEYRRSVGLSVSEIVQSAKADWTQEKQPQDETTPPAAD